MKTFPPRLAGLGLLLVWALPALHAQIAPSGSPVPLWPEGTPGALGEGEGHAPTLTPFLPAPEKRTGASMLVLPGGGYSHLAAHEGAGYAEWLRDQGVACYVLKYRLGSAGYRHPRMLEDAARGLRMVRAFARRDGLDPARVGVIGSSAGGHLAATLLTHFDVGRNDAGDPFERESSRPDLGILCYPVISFGEFRHDGSRRQLLGENPSPELIHELSNELQVRPDTPPCFIWHTWEDKTVPVENALLFGAALRKAGVPFDLHIYEKGRHGLGLGRPEGEAPPWAADCLYWLNQRGFVK
jgi:acetyl esterase/lipase